MIEIEKSTLHRIRGFEKVGSEQFIKDIKELGHIEHNLVDSRIWEDTPTLPKRGSKHSACYDFYNTLGDIELHPNASIIIPTGIKAYMQPNEVLKVYPRSGLGFKYQAVLSNTVGVIDCDFFDNPKNEGHILIKMVNKGDKILEIKYQDRFCQGMFQNYLIVDGDSFDKGDIREGGFGSTGSR